MGLGHHQDNEDCVGRADACKVEEQAPGTQEGHDGGCHLYLRIFVVMNDDDVDGDLYRDEDAGKLDGHQSSRDNTFQLRRKPLRWTKKISPKR